MTDGPFARLVARLDHVKPSGAGVTARCPNHDDGRNSLKVDRGDDGRVLVHCHAGCETAAVVAKLGLTLADLYPPREEAVRQNGHGRRMLATYDYRDRDGALLYQSVRYDPKGFTQRRPDERGGWIDNLAGVERVLYRLPELLAADPSEDVYLCEGEKDVERLRALGFVATTNAAGADQWRPEYTTDLCGRRVVILEDNDEAGRKRTAKVSAALAGVAAETRVLALPGLPDKGDVSNWLDAVGTAEELRRLVADAPTWEPGPAADPIFEDSEDASPDDPPAWEAPVPLPEGERPPFPTEALPSVLRAFVEALARATQTPTALAGLLVLAAVAAAAAKRVAVLVRAGWREPVNLYATVALDPGNRKTAVVREVAAPLQAFEQAEAKRMAAEIALAENRRKIAEKALEKAQREAANANPENPAGFWNARETADRLAKELAELVVPSAPRLLVDDVTPEKLAAMLGDNGGRMAVLSAEGGLFDIMAGRFSKDGKSPNLDLFLKAHAGDDLPVDRIGRPGHRLAAPALTLGLAVQPSVLRGLAARPGFRGVGLLARFCYAVPDSPVGRRRIGPPPVPPAVADAYAAAVAAVLALAPLTEEDGSPKPRALVLGPEAAARMIRFETDLEPRLGPDGDLGHVQDWGAKLAGLVARLAGLSHTVEHAHAGQVPWEHDIPVGTVEAAIRLAETFLVPHALSAFAQMGADPALEDARLVLAALQRLDFTDQAGQAVRWFSRRDLHQRSFKHRFDAPDDLDRPLAVLVKHGYIRPSPLPPRKKDEPAPRGRPRSDRYDINPRTRSQNPQYPQKPEPVPHSEDIADFADGFAADADENGEEMEWIA